MGVAEPRQPGSLLKRIVSEAALTLVADAAVLVAFFVFYRLLLDQYGAENLGLYALMRRYSAIAVPLLVLGLSDGLARFVAQTATPATRTRLVIAGAFGVLVANAVACAAVNADPAASAGWLFGDAGAREAVMPFSLLVVGLSTHLFVYGCHRGHLRIALLNAMQLFNLGVMPVALLLLFPHATFTRMVALIGIAHVAVALGFLAPLLRKPSVQIAAEAQPASARSLYAFGVSRIPAAMVGAALASVAPIIAKDYVSLTEVGYLALALALLIAVGGAIAPLGTVLLPHISALRSDTRAVGERLHLLIGFTLQVYLFGTLQFLALADYLIASWMGTGFLPAVTVTRIVLASLPFYGFYCAARGVLDAVSTRPINSVNTVISLLVLLGVLLAAVNFRARLDFGLIDLFGFGCALAVAVLGLLSYAALRTIFPRDRGKDARHAVWGLVLAGGLFVLSIAVRPLVTSSLPLLAAYECLLFCLYVAALHLLRFEWPRIVLGRAAP
jgi:O-antigen/teichoic acid export membrane protein